MEQPLISQMAQQEGVINLLKAEDQLECVQRMSSIRNCVDEITLQDLQVLIYI